jgi:predicted PurR-regulated permease PerM
MNAPARPRGPNSRSERLNVHGVVLYTLALLAGAVLVVLAVRVLLAAFAGVLFAIVLRTVASFVARHLRVPYGVVLAVVVVLALGGAVLAVVLAVPRLAEELEAFREALPPAVSKLAESTGYGNLLEHGLGKGTQLEQLHLEKMLHSVLSTVGTTFDALAGLVICFFVAIYGAAEPGAYERALLAVVPARRRELTRAVVKEATNELSHWLLGRLLAMLFVGVTSAVAFVLLHVPLAIPLALLAGVLTFVEYLGAVASALPAVLLAFSQGPLQALWVGLTFTALHVVEGYVLTPLLARNMVRIPPALTLVAQALFGTLVGVLGLTFSTPFLVVAVVVGKEWRQRSASERAPKPTPTPSAA